MSRRSHPLITVVCTTLNWSFKALHLDAHSVLHYNTLTLRYDAFNTVALLLKGNV